MQEFFMDYGLWLLIALLVVIGVVFLLSGKRKPDPTSPAVVEDTAVAVTPSEVAPMDMSASPLPVPDPVVIPESPAIVAPDPEPLATVEPVVAPDPAPAPVASATVGNAADDLLKLKGVGPKLAALLHELGVTRFGQIAAWSDSDIAAIDAKLGNFKGRPVRDQWIDQAKYLAAGDIAGFEAKYGKL